MKIRLIEDDVRLRATAEFSQRNTIRLLSVGTIFNNAQRDGDWWRVDDGYVHASMVAEVTASEEETASKKALMPYRSQWDSDAYNRTADCGQTCVAMMAEWQGVVVAVNSLPFQTAPEGYTTGRDLVKNFAKIGLKAVAKQIKLGETPPLPSICLMWYGGLHRENVQDKAFKGWHWLILLAVGKKEVTVNDPNYWDKRREEGVSKRYSLEEWERSFIPYSGTSKAQYVALVDADDNPIVFK
jgi:hypothetical protein